jgi:ABC-2 type transport system permease protein
VAGAAAGSVGIAFLGVGLLSAEFMSTSREANGIASALVVLAYLLRGFGDATGKVSQDGLGITAAWPSWLSPIGWGQQTFAYTGNRLWPIALPLVLGAACIAVVIVLMSRRDVGASVLTGRAGRADARASLRGPFSLAVRLQQGAIIGWCMGGLATGLLAGALGSAVQQAFNDAPSITSVLRAMVQAQGTSTTQLVISVLFEFAGVLAAACCLQTIIRLRQEEAAGTAALVVAQPLSRVHLLASFLALGAASVMLVMAFAAVGAWASLLASGDTSSAVTDVWQTAADQLPAALIYLALPAAAFVFWPRSTMPLGWGTLVLGVMIGIYGGMIGLDKNIRDLSPFTHTPIPSTSGSDWTEGFWMLGIAGVLTIVALVAMRRREIGSA